MPVLREFHLPSASVVALTGCFVAAIGAARSTFKNSVLSGIRDAGEWAAIVLVSGVPLLVGALIRGCFSGDGLLFWLLIPAPSVFLGFAIGRYFRMAGFRFPALLSMFTLLFISIVLFLIEFYNYPQLYFFNHVWGHFPGPLYDGHISFNINTLFFRYMTVAWAGVVWLAPSFHKTKAVRLPVLLITLSLILCYMNLSRAGVISPEESIRKNLGGMMQTTFGIVWYDQSLPEAEIRLLADLKDFHIGEIAETLELDMSGFPPVHTYIYRHEWQKKRLTGAGQTSYVPVWHRNPQLHTHFPVAQRVLRHELVHVLAKDFSNRWIGASPSIGMTEGLAAALESRNNPAISPDQLVAGQDAFPDVEYMRGLMGWTGFYEKSGRLSYTVSGSFMGWLLDNYPADQIKKAYRKGRFDGIFEDGFETLVSGWHQHLSTIPVDTADRIASARLFALPGIAEVRCAFVQSRRQARLEQARMMLATGDREGAFALLTETVRNERIIPSTVELWGVTGLALGMEAMITEVLDTKHPGPSDLRARQVYADALFLTGRVYEAHRVMGIREDQQQAYPLRSDPDIWGQMLQVRYGDNALPVDSLFKVVRPVYLSRMMRDDPGHAWWEETDPALFDFSDGRAFSTFHAYSYFLAKKGEPGMGLQVLDGLRPHHQGLAARQMLDEAERFMYFLMKPEYFND